MLNIILNDIYTSLIEYIELAVGFSVLVILIVYALKILLIPNRINMPLKTRLWRLVLIFSFNIYLFLIISITILCREPGSRSEVSLMVFDTFSKDLSGNVYPIENILLFIPFGLLLPLLNKRLHTVIRTTGLGLMSSLLIEVTQYITQRGYFQIDDIITNVLGTIIGYLIFIVVNRFYKTIQSS